MSRRGSAARRWQDEIPPEDDLPEVVAEPQDTAQLSLDPLLDEDLRRLRRDFAFARSVLEAMIAHEPVAVRGLLASPLSTHLPRAVREEAQLFSSLSRSSLRAPMQAMLYHRRLAHLLAHRMGVPVESVL
jgi:hypothetical protein